MVIFVGMAFSGYNHQKEEVDIARTRVRDPRDSFSTVTVSLDGAGEPKDLPEDFPEELWNFPFIAGREFEHGGSPSAIRCAREICRMLNVVWKASDGLPSNPSLFSYEKRIIEFYREKELLGDDLFSEDSGPDEQNRRNKMASLLRQGCPPSWPEVVDLSAPPHNFSVLESPFGEMEKGKHRPRDARIMVDARHNGESRSSELLLPEAGPRANLVFPQTGAGLRVGIIVCGGIAPGINAVIDGIVQRHYEYAGLRGEVARYELTVRGFIEGFRALDAIPINTVNLIPEDHHFYRRGEGRQIAMSEFASTGGSILGTYRLDSLLDEDMRENALSRIYERLSETAA